MVAPRRLFAVFMQNDASVYALNGVFNVKKHAAEKRARKNGEIFAARIRIKVENFIDKSF